MQMPTTIADRLASDRSAARQAGRAGDYPTAWRLLEATHVLSQPWAWPHVRSHLDMLWLALRTGDGREVVGQLFRTAVAGPASAVGRYPEGNTGRARVPATRPMAMPEELSALLAAAGAGRTEETR